MRLDVTLELPGHAADRGTYQAIVVRGDRRHLPVGAERPVMVAPGAIRVYLKAGLTDPQLRGDSIILAPEIAA